MEKCKARAYIFPPKLSKFPRLWPTGAELWPEPVLRTRSIRLRTDWSDRSDRTSGCNSNYSIVDLVQPEDVSRKKIESYYKYILRVGVIAILPPIQTSLHISPEPSSDCNHKTSLRDAATFF